MKTVIDAVNEFKGIRPSNLINRNGWAYAWKGESPLDAYKFKGRLVCTFEQFNTIVQECMTNFGSSVTYDEYKDSCKARLESPLDDDSHQAKVNNIGNVLHNMSCSMDDENEQNEFGNYASYLWDLAGYFRNQTCYSVPQPKESNMKPVFKIAKESKVDYTSEEFWKDAPEGATHVDVCGCFFKIATVGCNDMMILKGAWVHVAVVQNEVDKLTPRPKPQPIFTKAMQEAGELPSVGMECLIMYSSSNYKGTITYMGDGVGVYRSKDNNKEYTFALVSVKFRSLDTRTDKEKAFDEYWETVPTWSSPEDYKSDMCKSFNAGVKWVGE